MKLAKPVKIEPDGVIIAFRNERLVSQINDTNKKQMIIDAANTMFNQSSTPVTVKMVQFGENKQTSVQHTTESQEEDSEPDEPAPAVRKTEKAQEIKVTKEEVKPASESTSIRNEDESGEETKKNKDRIETDQEKMILELFDGKYVE